MSNFHVSLLVTESGTRQYRAGRLATEIKVLADDGIEDDARALAAISPQTSSKVV